MQRFERALLGAQRGKYHLALDNPRVSHLLNATTAENILRANGSAFGEMHGTRHTRGSRPIFCSTRGAQVNLRAAICAHVGPLNPARTPIETRSFDDDEIAFCLIIYVMNIKYLLANEWHYVIAKRHIQALTSEDKP